MTLAVAAASSHPFLSFSSPYARPPAWLASLDHLEQLRPARVIPRHGGERGAAFRRAPKSILTWPAPASMTTCGNSGYNWFARLLITKTRRSRRSRNL